ncbi:DUF3060 domain-containing protein [Caulobacter endophyticus]|uniref:DUF3060 domain-containing protein n=1 Tax=Caulobacter endophyticus TaxID=2172652 RepID=A0A2T9JJ76_9CAUL|nr:DUF3060 domain-containing protein [Caulobacter endophyticus]PVM83761.1 hypothetical protein DDF67_20025 [Caulobacter endophyticus]
MIIVPAFAILAMLAAAPPQATGPVEASGKAIAISGTDHVETLSCEGRAVAITGVDNTVTLTGVCKSVEISGSGNTVSATIAPGGVLSVTGTDQKVRWRSAGEVRRSVSGVDNQVVREK